MRERRAPPRPLVDVDVTQAQGDAFLYRREQQGSGSGLTFPKLFAGAPFRVKATELGGESRTVQANGSFANGATRGSINLTFPPPARSWSPSHRMIQTPYRSPHPRK